MTTGGMGIDRSTFDPTSGRGDPGAVGANAAMAVSPITRNCKSGGASVNHSMTASLRARRVCWLRWRGSGVVSDALGWFDQGVYAGRPIELCRITPLLG